MIHPDPACRITATQAYHHPALRPSAPSVIITPHFVRAATTFDYQDEPLPSLPAQDAASKFDSNNDKKSIKKTKSMKFQPQVSTPTALGESIKQHTTVFKPTASDKAVKAMRRDAGTPSPQKVDKLVIRHTRDEIVLDYQGEDKENEDPTRRSSCKLLLGC